MAYEEIVDALETTWATLASTLADLTDDEALRPTPCPGWSVRDVVAHLVGFERMLQGEPVPAFAGEYPAYVHNPIGEVNEAVVAFWRARPLAELRAAFAETSAASIARLRRLTREEWERVGWSPEGERPYHRFMETRVLDSWIHLGDVRDGLGLEGDDHGPGEAVVLARFVAALPYVLGKRVAAPEGARVAVTLRGPRGARHVVGVEAGRGVAMDPGVVTDDELDTSTALFWRRCAGRIDARRLLEDRATAVRGDRDLVAALVAGLVVMI